jgi:phosphoribosylanthranilate isomerase
VFVKICGITTEEDALLSVAMGADAVGFIFAPSTRQVAAGAVAQITARLPPEMITVGVFRDTLVDRVIEVANQAGLKAVQLSGHEPPSDVTALRAHFPLVIKAFAASSSLLTDAAGYEPDAIMIDGPSPGSGRVFDWRLAEGLPRIARTILAGGLDAQNVASAIERLHPWGVDVNSGVEASPGHKDPRKLRAFIRAARAAAPAAFEPEGDRLYDWQEEL